MTKIFSDNDLKKIHFSIIALSNKNDFLIFGYLKNYDNKEEYHFDSWLEGNLFDLIPEAEQTSLKFKKNEVICGCVFEGIKEMCHDLYVIPVMRGNGIATHMYKYIEHKFDTELKPAPNQTEDGKEFWKVYKKPSKIFNI